MLTSYCTHTIENLHSKTDKQSTFANVLLQVFLFVYIFTYLHILRCQNKKKLTSEYHTAKTRFFTHSSEKRQKALIPRLHDQAVIKQTSSRHRANVEQLEHTSCTCILNAFARCLLDRVKGI